MFMEVLEMKRLWWGPALALLVLLIAAVPVFAAPPADNPGKDKGPVDKIVFIHYPKNEPGKASKSATGGGVLSSTYKYTGIHWFDMPVNYIVNPANSGVDAGVTGTAVQASFAAWDNASGPLQFSYAGSMGLAAGKYDGSNVISWANISTLYPRAIAVTSIWYYRNSKEITEVDTQMNNGPGFAWSYTIPDATTGYDDPGNGPVEGATTYDIRNIMTHEAGHWIMLGDLYNSRDSFLTMYGYGSLGELRKDTLGYGDVLGVRRAYP